MTGRNPADAVAEGVNRGAWPGIIGSAVGKCKRDLSAEQIEAISRAVADPRRFGILQSIAAQSCTPCSAVREQHPITPATVSHHLKELEAAGLIAFEREGRTMRMIFKRDLWRQYLKHLAEI